METAQYTRSLGLRLTYTIQVNRNGTYVISLAGKVLKVGIDAAVANGLVAAGDDSLRHALAAARANIESLQKMQEQ